MAQTSNISPGDRPDRVWSLADLELLHEVEKPIIVVVTSTHDDPSSPGGVRATTDVPFQNATCVKQYGLKRPREEYERVLSGWTEEQSLRRRRFLAAVTEGKEAKEFWLDIRPLMHLFCQGYAKEGPMRITKFLSKPIQLETSPGCVETAAMHIIEPEQASIADSRVCAMHDRDPIHTMLYDSKGVLLSANKAAMTAFHIDTPGSHMPYAEALTIKRLFDAGAYPGGQEEADRAYHEAMHAVFTDQVDCHRHSQPFSRKKDGKVRWAMLEMWPMLDPVSQSAAVLVKTSNITQMKLLELELAGRQDSLQRHNEELEQDSVAMQAEARKLQREANSLARRLEAVMHDKLKDRTSFDAATPIDKTLEYLQNAIMGRAQDVQEAVDLYNMLSDSDTNLRQPIGMANQLFQEGMDSDVARSMLQLLQGNELRKSEPDAAETAAQEAAAPAAQLASWKTVAHMDWREQVEEQASAGDVATTSPPATAAAESLAVIPAPVTLAVERMLQDASTNWQFDIFALADATPGYTLSLLTFHVMKQSGLVQEFSLDEPKLQAYLQQIEQGYNPLIPYHNSVHVASVVQITHMLLTRGGVMKSNAMTRLQQLATYIAAFIHDFQHGGVNNDFLIKTFHPLAMTYNDISPLENHHLASALVLLHQPQHLFLSKERVSAEQVGTMRGVTISEVLGTDMKKHFDITSRFQMLLKCADIGHLAAAPALHQRWAYQLEEEFFRQGDQERGLGLPVSPLMDRNLRGGMTKSQVGFFSIVGIPQFKAMTDLFEDAKPMLEGVLENYHRWEAAAAAAGL
ncbi:TPA: putative 3',5'-cyclic phosphodiesterase pde-3 [Trebouxia sp. C0006]